MAGHLRQHSFTDSTDHDFTGLVAGELILFNGTNLVSTGSTGGGTSGNLWSASTGTSSIIANNGGGNTVSDSLSAVLGGDQNKITGGTGSNNTIINGRFNKMGTSTNYSFVS